MLLRLIRLLSGPTSSEMKNSLDEAQKALKLNASKNVESGKKLKSAVDEARKKQTELRRCFEE